ncbi:MAG TPA: hypothetical protein VL854_11580 [Nitrososphaeraceae archaeon]|nr:hypothetical protein [Nitrososphaeraceae archaeon]
MVTKKAQIFIIVSTATISVLASPETKPRPQTTCPTCGIIGDAFYMRIHIENCEGTDY